MIKKSRGPEDDEQDYDGNGSDATSMTSHNEGSQDSPEAGSLGNRSYSTDSEESGSQQASTSTRKGEEESLLSPSTENEKGDQQQSRLDEEAEEAENDAERDEVMPFIDDRLIQKWRFKWGSTLFNDAEHLPLNCDNWQTQLEVEKEPVAYFSPNCICCLRPWLCVILLSLIWERTKKHTEHAGPKQTWRLLC